MVCNNIEGLNSFVYTKTKLAYDYSFIRLKPQYYIVHLSKNYCIKKIQLKQMRYVAPANRKLYLAHGLGRHFGLHV